MPVIMRDIETAGTEIAIAIFTVSGRGGPFSEEEVEVGGVADVVSVGSLVFSAGDITVLVV